MTIIWICWIPSSSWWWWWWLMVLRDRLFPLVSPLPTQKIQRNSRKVLVVLLYVQMPLILCELIPAVQSHLSPLRLQNIENVTMRRNQEYCQSFLTSSSDAESSRLLFFIFVFKNYFYVFFLFLKLVKIIFFLFSKNHSLFYFILKNYFQ